MGYVKIPGLRHTNQLTSQALNEPPITINKAIPLPDANSVAQCSVAEPCMTQPWPRFRAKHTQEHKVLGFSVVLLKYYADINLTVFL